MEIDWEDDGWEPGQGVELTLDELAMAAAVGVRRRIESIRQNLKPAYGFDDIDCWSRDIEAAAAEMAFAKLLGVHFDGTVNSFKAADVAGVWQVRYSSRADARLIVRPGDSDTDKFVLVIGKAPHFRVMGWTIGRTAKLPCRLSAPNGRPPAYFVSQSSLRPIETLTANTEAPRQ